MHNEYFSLRPCPFCGSINIGIEQSRKVDGCGEFPLMAHVECYDCGAQTRPMIVDGYYGYTTTVADVVGAWNRSADC